MADAGDQTSQPVFYMHFTGHRWRQVSTLPFSKADHRAPIRAYVDSTKPRGPSIILEKRGNGILMPLRRGQVVGYDTNRMIFEFTMVAPDATNVVCQISSAAMDELAGLKGTRPTEREAQFLRLRATIERIASDNFDEDNVDRGPIVQIFAKHIRQQ